VAQRQLERPAGRGSRRRETSWIDRHVGLLACLALVLVIALVVAITRASTTPATRTAPAVKQQPQQVRYLGVYEPGAPSTYAGIEQFAHAIGRQPNLVSYYSGWNEVFQRSFAETAASYGATTIVQMDPTGISLARIADGTYDSYLKSFASQVAAFGRTVVISFGHEMNGYWEPWGYHHAPPADFVAAWRHVVTLFRDHGAGNVTWLWQVNSSRSLTGPVRDWWPGSQYVNWIGVSGYYYVPGNKFSNVFTPVVSEIRKFSQAPLLIAETGVGPQAGQAQGIKNLFTGLRTQHYLGLVWFDQHSYGGLYKGENWRLEDSTAALSAFRTALKG
jgi:mannan endo-1,4-beta-mannosidase